MVQNSLGLAEITCHVEGNLETELRKVHIALGLVDIARHVLGCLVTQEKTVQNALGMACISHHVTGRNSPQGTRVRVYLTWRAVPARPYLMVRSTQVHLPPGPLT